ncbi:hypothetical protein O3M35_007060 [Rhynocoris fuscipes]|uniref:Uncharacterized protein n=1 Tax=Rhynocoris fuscipes TaxID=488301 RepID=A0AAW1DF44_9HEMI
MNFIISSGIIYQILALLFSIQAISSYKIEINSKYNEELIVVKNQLISMSIGIDHLIEKFNTDENSKFQILTADSGQFKKPTDRKDLLNKLNELKNNITKMIDDMTTHAGDITSIKDRINMLEKELENLTKQLSNAGHDVQQELKDFSNQLSKLTASLNDYYRKQEQKEINEFAKAIKTKYYDYAAFKLSMIEDENKINVMIVAAFKLVNLNVDNLLEFIKFIKEPKQKYLVYKSLYIYLATKKEKRISDFCAKYVELNDAINEDKSIETELKNNALLPEVNDEEFFAAMKNKYFKCAEYMFSKIIDANKIENLTHNAYKYINLNIDSFFELIKLIKDSKQRYYIYKALYSYIESNEKNRINDFCPKYVKLNDAIIEDNSIKAELKDITLFYEIRAEEFLAAMKNNYFDCAGYMLTFINDDNKIVNLTINACEEYEKNYANQNGEIMLKFLSLLTCIKKKHQLEQVFYTIRSHIKKTEKNYSHNQSVGDFVFGYAVMYNNSHRDGRRILTKGACVLQPYIN